MLLEHACHELQDRVIRSRYAADLIARVETDLIARVSTVATVAATITVTVLRKLHNNRNQDTNANR